mmetsp:Transcript_38951/g.90627  ORF Transcript_38951/g.90627 Transcript_38951/m.90627 type:complete len:125 (-) Transcript_38951:181-555(-)
MESNSLKDEMRVPLMSGNWALQNKKHYPNVRLQGEAAKRVYQIKPIAGDRGFSIGINLVNIFISLVPGHNTLEIDIGSIKTEEVKETFSNIFSDDSRRLSLLNKVAPLRSLYLPTPESSGNKEE